MYVFYIRNRNNGFGNIICIWVLGPLGVVVGQCNSVFLKNVMRVLLTYTPITSPRRHSWYITDGHRNPCRASVMAFA